MPHPGVSGRRHERGSSVVAQRGLDLLDTLLKLHGAEELGRRYLFVRLARINIAGHIDYSETSRILQSIRRRADWVPIWLAASERHAGIARAAEAAGATTSAGDGYLRAALCAHWATLFAAGQNKNDAHRISLDLYAKGAAWHEPPTRRLEIPFQEDVLPAYLRLPSTKPLRGVVLMIGGADTNKEELHHWGTEFTRRGLGVVPFDGPGQGEMAARYGRLVMRFDTFHRAVSATIDWLELQDMEVDSARVGVFGNSLGVYLALDAALRDERIGAVISNGGFCDARGAEGWPPSVMSAFSSCLGIEDETTLLTNINEQLDLASVPALNPPPALVVHGGREELSEEEESRDAARTVDGTLLVVEDAWHTCTNRDHLASSIFADWMTAALEGRVTTGYREVRATDEHDYANVLPLWN
jgi:hypothetical protein